ncbi:unnamed protein product [Onchocerca flexuosa]|uniref:Uncharacterized protein n=1 Tax=Onchocerca flexuosa TaxID=387005 RepID=A0A183HVY7_9BILA|nr:unnamed protein product [Onchocerca flexuosa]
MQQCYYTFFIAEQWSLLLFKACCSSLHQCHKQTNLRHELLPYDVDVIEIAPGCFETGMTNIETSMKMYDTVWYRASQKLRDEFGHDYNDKAKKCLKEIQSKLVATETTWVIDAYYEAIVAKRPKLLYRIGWDALFMFHPYSLLPLRVQLYIMKFIMNLCGAPSPIITTKYACSGNPERKVN